MVPCCTPACWSVNCGRRSVGRWPAKPAETLPASRSSLILKAAAVTDEMHSPMTSRLPGPLRRVSRLRSRGVSRLSLRAALEAQDDIATTLLSVGSETRGLSEEEAVRRLARHGPNRLSAAGPRRRTTVLKAALTDLQSLSLLLIGLVALLASPANLPGFLVMVLLVALTAVGALLRNRANRQTALDLAELAGTASTVLRRQGNGEPDWRTISSREVVRGDIVRLGPGYRVPADLRLIEAQQLTVDQSLMTVTAVRWPRAPAAAAIRGSFACGATRSIRPACRTSCSRAVSCSAEPGRAWSSRPASRLTTVRWRGHCCMTTVTPGTSSSARPCSCRGSCCSYRSRPCCAPATPRTCRDCCG